MFASWAEQVERGEFLSRETLFNAVSSLITDDFNEQQASRFLSALSKRGETAEELAGACAAVMANSIAFDAPANAMDVCGTGGDGKHTFNISTATAFIVAAAGVPIVKHGNRSVSSRSGSSDVLSALGIPHTLPAHFWERMAQTHKLAFLYAPLFHPALAKVAPMRRAMGTRTLFNIIGPLCNPARVKRQLIGVYNRERMQVVGELMRQRGDMQAYVVHGEDGGDELSISSKSYVVEVRADSVRDFTLSPETVGLPFFPESALVGGSPEENANALIALLNGTETNAAYRAVCCLNAGAALHIAGAASTLNAGVALASETLVSSAPLALLDQLRDAAQKENHG